MKLYYSTGACSLAPMILAEWLDLPLDIERVTDRSPGSAFSKINPLGAVPALELDDGKVRNQVDAILQYFLALKPGADFGPRGDIDEAFELDRWIAFLTGDFHPPFGVWFNPRRFTTDHSDAGLAAVKAASATRIAAMARVLEDQIGAEGFIALHRKTLLDAYAYSMVRWIKNLDGGFEPYPKLTAFMAKMSADEGVKAALQRERS